MIWELHLYLCQENVLNIQRGWTEYDLIFKADAFWRIWFPFPSKSQALGSERYCLQRPTSPSFSLGSTMTHTSLGKKQPLSQGRNKEWGKLREACWAFLSRLSRYVPRPRSRVISQIHLQLRKNTNRLWWGSLLLVIIAKITEEAWVYMVFMSWRAQR